MDDEEEHDDVKKKKHHHHHHHSAQKNDLDDEEEEEDYDEEDDEEVSRANSHNLYLFSSKTSLLMMTRSIMARKMAGLRLLAVQGIMVMKAGKRRGGRSTGSSTRRTST